MIQVGWGNTAQQYLVWKIFDGWTADNYKQALEQTAHMISGICNVPLLVDMRRTECNDSVTLINHSVSYQTLPIKQVIVIGTPDSLQSINRSLSPVFDNYNLQFELVDDVDVAYRLIAGYRDSPAGSQV